MQNNEHSESNRFRKFFQEKGYYIVLLLCILAVGISGYIFVSGAVSEKKSLNEQTLSVATSAEIPEDKPSSSSSGGKTQSGGSTQTQKPASASSGPADAADASAQEPASETLSVRVWPVSGERIAPYSMQELSFNQTTQDWRTHDGMDLAALAGEPVRAACTGTVTAVYDDEFFGTTVVLSHPEGYETIYANLAAMPAVSAGMRVTAGDTIGSVGESALLESASASHLHFAVRQNGESVDPVRFID